MFSQQRPSWSVASAQFDRRWASIYVSVIHSIFLLFFLVVIHIDIGMAESQETFEQAKARVIKCSDETLKKKLIKLGLCQLLS